MVHRPGPRNAAAAAPRLLVRSRSYTANESGRRASSSPNSAQLATQHRLAARPSPALSRSRTDAAEPRPLLVRRPPCSSRPSRARHARPPPPTLPTYLWVCGKPAGARSPVSSRGPSHAPPALTHLTPPPSDPNASLRTHALLPMGRSTPSSAYSCSLAPHSADL